MDENRKTEYAESGGTGTFTLENGTTHQLRACRVEHAAMMCEVMDYISKMTPYERRSIIVMATDYEMENMYPKSTAPA